MIFETFPVGMLACNCTIIGDEQTRHAIVVDGGDGVPTVMDKLKQLGLHAKYLIHTHAHFDHISDVGGLRERTGAEALLHGADLIIYHEQPRLVRMFGLPPIPDPVELDGNLADGDKFVLGGKLDVHVLHTPGHTPGSVCFCVQNETETKLVTGDTLFAGGIGRWDLGGTSMDDIVHSIKDRLMVFPDETPVIPGHGAVTTIGHERRTNPYLA